MYIIWVKKIMWILEKKSIIKYLQAALIRWGREKPLKEYDFEHSTRHETIRRRKIDTDDSEVKLVSYSLEKNSDDLLDDKEHTSDYTPYTEDGNEWQQLAQRIMTYFVLNILSARYHFSSYSTVPRLHLCFSCTFFPLQSTSQVPDSHPYFSEQVPTLH